VFRTQALLPRVQQIKPPDDGTQTHAMLDGFVKRALEWLQLELAYSQYGDDKKRVQANDMIPEINAREAEAIRVLYDLEFNYNLR
jgi:hypothetical protein